MKKIILSILLALSCSQTCFANTQYFYQEALKQVSEHERVDVRPYINASYHVAKMWREFPDPNFYQRVSCYIGWGGKESNFTPNYVNVNIPGIKLTGLPGMHIKHFSLDYSWAGLNEQAVIPTYTVARALQTGRVMSRAELMQLGLRPDLYSRISRVLKVPKDLDLFKIDLATAVQAKKEYADARHRHLRAKDIQISVPYAEDTQDKIDSVLLYRTIEEYDRSLRGWPWQTYDSDAYYICQDIINK